MKRVRKFLAGVALGLMIVATPVSMTGCGSIAGIFRSDPLGASLKTAKDTYEASVKTAGRLYASGQIAEAQLRRFRDEANKFYKAYTELSTVHELQGVKEGDVRIEELSRLLDILVNTVAAFSAQGVK